MGNLSNLRDSIAETDVAAANAKTEKEKDTDKTSVPVGRSTPPKKDIWFDRDTKVADAIKTHKKYLDEEVKSYREHITACEDILQMIDPGVVDDVEDEMKLLGEPHDRH